jgi:Protein of unknown function (DUF1236)
MSTHFRHAAVALALVAGAGGANAQTVITREITTEPVETIIERGPTGTVITRRPLDAAVPRPALSGETVVTEPIETFRRSRETVGVSTTTVEPAETVTRRAAAPAARPAATRKQASTKAQPVRRTAVQAARPRRSVIDATPVETAVVLSPAQRSTIYRTIVEERVVPRTVVARPLPVPLFGTPFAPPVAEQVVTGRVITRSAGTGVVAESIEPEPLVTRRVITTTPGVTDRVVTAPRVAVAVGARVPTTVPLYALPETVARQWPSIGSYQYAVVDDRVFLVDPETSLIMAELNE